MRESRSPLKRAALSVALTLALAPFAAAQAQQAPQAEDHTRQHGHPSEPKNLQAVEVRATPLADTAENLTIPVEVLVGSKLDEAKAGTLGATVERLPGVQSASFGPGVGRPIIRGLDGARVQVLSDGLGSGDVSTVSVDHAVSIEPFLADQIEVLKGPATLLYGSGAIGGAVNVVDGRIPESLGDAPFSGRAELRGGSANDERTGLLRLDGNTGAFAFHFDALHREAGDYAIPGYAESAAHMAEEGESPDPDEKGTLDNSAVRTDGASLGVSWIGGSGFLGAAYSLFNTRYGIPGGAHQHAEGDGEHDHEGEEHEGEGHEEEGPVQIRLDQRRTEVRGGWNAIGPFASLRVKLANTDYTHTEFEGEEVGTVFFNDSTELRAELVHQPLAGWDGALGLQASKRDFSAVGAEAFVPSSLSRDVGIFWVGKHGFNIGGRDLQLDLGLRHDRVRMDVSGTAPDRDFANTSASLGLTWHARDALHFNIGLDRAQRSPTAEELYSNGLHVATGGFELGDTGLDRETANRIEVGMRVHHGPIEAAITAWRAEYQDFVFLASTDAEIEGAPLRVWHQGDARFTGAEAKLDWDIADTRSGSWTLGLFGDLVRARLGDPAGTTSTIEVEVPHDDHAHAIEANVATGGNLPRIAPARLGAQLRWESGAWRASLGAVRYARQDRVAEFEEETAGYTLVDAHVAWHLDGTDGRALEVFLDGANLTNREARPHTSFLKDVVPLPGRNIMFGVRALF